MKVGSWPTVGRKCLILVPLLWGLGVPWAVAGPQQDTELAEKEFARGDLFVSMGLWRKAAQEGYAPAQVRLAYILDQSDEDVEAIGWYRKAADQGSVAGEFGLGEMYAKGEGVKKDMELARTHVLSAAEKNHPPAALLMMMAYRSGGLGLAVDNRKADEWEAKVMALIPEYKKKQEKPVTKPKKGYYR